MGPLDYIMSGGASLTQHPPGLGVSAHGILGCLFPVRLPNGDPARDKRQTMAQDQSTQDRLDCKRWPFHVEDRQYGYTSDLLWECGIRLHGFAQAVAAVAAARNDFPCECRLYA